MSITFMNRTSQVAIAARSMILATVIVFAASVFGRHPAMAYEAPWCAVISEGYWDCQYRSNRRMSAECIGRQSWLVQSEPVLRRRIRGAKADPETSRSSAIVTGHIVNVR